MKQLIHRMFNLHKWEYTSEHGWDYSEPRDDSGDYLPTQWKEYKCNCGMYKRIYTDGFTHLGTSAPREYIVRGHQ